MRSRSQNSATYAICDLWSTNIDIFLEVVIQTKYFINVEYFREHDYIVGVDDADVKDKDAKYLQDLLQSSLLGIRKDQKAMELVSRLCKK